MLKDILLDAGINDCKFSVVSGGDINQAYYITSGDKHYFLKVNKASEFPGMFEKEGRGLDTLRKYCSLKIPVVLKIGMAAGYQYILMEWIEKGNARIDCMENLGVALAQMHKQPQEYFGFTEDNYIGSLLQKNSKQTSWASFYADCRILPFTKK